MTQGGHGWQRAAAGHSTRLTSSAGKSNVRMMLRRQPASRAIKARFRGSAARVCSFAITLPSSTRTHGARASGTRLPVRPKRVRAPSLSASAFQVGVVKTLDGRGAAPAAPHPALDRQACQAGADCGRGNGPSRVHHLAVRALPPRGCRARRHVPHIRAPLCRPCLYTRASRAGSCRWALRAGFRVPPPRRGRPLLKAAVHARRPPACTHTVPPLLCLDNGIFFLEKQRKRCNLVCKPVKTFTTAFPPQHLSARTVGRGRATRGQEQTMIRGNTVVSQARAEVCADVRARHGARLGGAVCICGGA